MANAHDVAAYILQKQSPMTAMKLQKLVYYSQAWSLVWDERPLFSETIEAWANGPVVPALYREHRGQFTVASWPTGNPSALSLDEQDTVNAVCKFYGQYTAQALSDLTHREKPWRDARRGLSSDERGEHEITHAALAEFYSSLSDPLA